MKTLSYDSSRVLICLLAPSALSCVEEYLVPLHYGCQDGHKGHLDRRHLPRQGRPETLQSIFNRPFPVARQGIPSRSSTTPAKSHLRCRLATQIEESSARL